jgi:gluconate 2-dehydrogenase alpha chain
MPSASRCCADLRLEGQRHPHEPLRHRQAVKIAHELKAREIKVTVKDFGAAPDLRSYQTTHWAGGVAMGTDRPPAWSTATCRAGTCTTCLRWARACSQGIGYNPTGAAVALTYWSARAIREQYLKDPRPLVSA